MTAAPTRIVAARRDRDGDDVPAPTKRRVMNQRNRRQHRHVQHRANVVLGSHPAVEVLQKAGQREAKPDAPENPHPRKTGVDSG